MRSSWSAEAILAVLAAASLEAAGLTLAALALDWAGGNSDSPFGITSFAVAVVIGLAVARRLRRATWRRYLVEVPITTVLVAVVGGALILAVAGDPTDPISLAGRAGTWLLGIGVLRGTAHAEPDDLGLTADALLRIGLPGITGFWILAVASGLSRDAGHAGAAYVATLTFISSALLGLGLARLRELQVEAIDRAARRRWLVLLFGVGGLVLLVGIPLAGLLGIPVAMAVTGAAGPVAWLLIVAFAVLGVPILFLAESLAHLIGPFDLKFTLPSIPGSAGRGAPASDDLSTTLVVIVGLFIAFDIVVALVLVAATLRRRRRRAPEPVGEVREGEPVDFGSLLRFPRLGLRRPRARVPRGAVEAYRLALSALDRRDEGRRLGETPREHAGRIRETPVGPAMARLAADYQLNALGGRHLTAAEERRALSRWRRIRRWTGSLGSDWYRISDSNR